MWKHNTTVSDGDLTDRIMLYGGDHHLHSIHHLTEGTMKGGSRIASRADAKAMLVHKLAEWNEEAIAWFLLVVVSPLQVSQQLLRARSVTLTPVLLATQCFLRPALVRYVAEARPNIRWSHCAHAERQKLLCPA